MSFRLEEKIKLHISDLTKLKNFIKNYSGKELYPKRKISSIYFDNKFLDMYKESEEGTVPRKKIRIRNYPNDEKKVKNLEIKITSVEGKFKKTHIVDDKTYKGYLERGIFDSSYGLCNKIIEISYLREYWSLKNARLTIDYNIEYKSPINYKNFFDNEILILEVKSSKDVITVQNLLSEILPLEKQRFSKYCEGINKIYNEDHSQRLFV